MAPTKQQQQQRASAAGADDQTEDQAPETGDQAARIADLERQLADAMKRDVPPEAGTLKPPPDTHLLIIANGDQVRTSSPVATHHTGEDGIAYPVVSVLELPREEV